MQNENVTYFPHSRKICDTQNIYGYTVFMTPSSRIVILPVIKKLTNGVKSFSFKIIASTDIELST